MEDTDYLKIHMFGGLSIYRGDRLVPMGNTNPTKMMQLFAIILSAGREGISKKRILSDLYGNDDLEDPGGTLRVNLHRLRKFLKKTELFGDLECICIKAGRYTWNWEEVPVELDTEIFCNAASQALKEKDESKKTELLLLACSIYRGEFLPELAGEEWAAILCSDFQRRYLECVREAGALLLEKKQYEILLGLSERACSIYPYEEFYLLRIDCLMGLGRYNEAMEIYEKATSFYFEELGLVPSDEMMKRFETMRERVRPREAFVRNIKEELREKKNRNGAYFCMYPSFVDCFHSACRIVERNGESALLILCTLKDRRRNPLQGGEKGREYMEKLKAAIAFSLRKSDIYTQYGDNQFLLLLIGVSRENSGIIEERIDRTFQKAEKSSRVMVEYLIQDALEGEMEGKTVKPEKGK